MARRKTGDYHMRVDPDNRAEWEACAKEAGLPLATWIECILNREVLDRERDRLLEQMYPQKARRGAQEALRG